MRYSLPLFFSLCVFFTAYSQVSSEICGNGIDDDGNGLTDCDDPFANCELFGFDCNREIDCSNGIDDDGDGDIDYYDSDCQNNPNNPNAYIASTWCTSSPASVGFEADVAWDSGIQTSAALGMPSVADLDQDGYPEVITMNSETGWLYILDGSTGNTLKQVRVKNGQVYPYPTVGDVDGDGYGEIFTIDLTGVIRAYEHDLTLKWTQASTFTGFGRHLSLADFNQDGKAELYYVNEIRDAESGTLLIKGSHGSSMYPSANFWQSELNAVPVAVDMLPSPGLELALGHIIYTVTISNPSGTAGNSLTEARNMNNAASKPADYLGYFPADADYGNQTYSTTSVIDFNQDGKLDVLMGGANGGANGPTTAFLWDVSNDQVKMYTVTRLANTIPTATINLRSQFRDMNGNSCDAGETCYWPRGMGSISIADMDGDGQLEATFTSGSSLYALETNFTEKWANHDDFWEISSGGTGVATYDFDGDGTAEILYRDEIDLYIIDGTTGQPLNNQISGTFCSSQTQVEYPIIADVDGDGETEIILSCGQAQNIWGHNPATSGTRTDGFIRAYKAAQGNTWTPARKVWNQYVYHNTNINDDLSVPRYQQAHHQSLNSNCSSVLPLNKFLSQSSLITPCGDPVFPAAKLDFEYMKISHPSCIESQVNVRLRFKNNGDKAVPNIIPISFYANNPAEVYTNVNTSPYLETININIPRGLQPGQLLDTIITVNAIHGEFELFASLNDIGQYNEYGSPVANEDFYPLNQLNGSFEECKDIPTILSKMVYPRPFEVKAVKIRDNRNCLGGASFNNGEVQVVAPDDAPLPASSYSFIWTNINTNQVVGTDAWLTGLNAGKYEVVVENTDYGCQSYADTVSIQRIEEWPDTQVITLEEIQPVSSCAPGTADGMARVLINGAALDETEYDIVWEDEQQPGVLAIGDTATILRPILYRVTVTNKLTGCSESKTLDMTLEMPEIGQPAITPNNNCKSPNGSVTVQLLYRSTTDYHYLLLGPGIYDTLYSTTPSFIGLAAGLYEIRAYDPTTECGLYHDGIQVEVMEQNINCEAGIGQIVSLEICENEVGSENALITLSDYSSSISTNTYDSIQWFTDSTFNTHVQDTDLIEVRTQTSFFAKIWNYDSVEKALLNFTILSKPVPLETHLVACEYGYIFLDDYNDKVHKDANISWYHDYELTSPASFESINYETAFFAKIDNGKCISVVSITFFQDHSFAFISGLSPTYCLREDTIMLSGYPYGGIFSGPGVTNVNGKAVLIVKNAGIGTHTISYTINENGCPYESSEEIRIYACDGLATHLQDSLGLVALYEATNGDEWKNNDNWLIGNVNSWHGINTLNGRVTGIDLEYNDLKGIIPAEITDMDSLKLVNLSYNYLTEVPDFTSIPTGLPEGLNIMHNLLTFKYIIPNTDIENLTYAPQKIIFKSDTVVRVPIGSSYTIDADIDDEVTNNTYIWSRSDNASKGTTNINKFTLNNLSLNDSQTYQCRVTNPDANELTLYVSRIVDLKVYVPSSVDIADSLALVELYNHTHGPLWEKNAGWLDAPVSSWYGVTVTNERVSELHLSDNNLQGSLPHQIGNLNQLTKLDITLNEIGGVLPESLKNLTKLEELKLSVNNFEGELPVGIKELKQLRIFDIGANKFTGTIPAEIQYLTKLQRFSAYVTGLSGEIPKEFKYLSSLSELNLAGNQMEGSIPSELAQLSYLYDLDLSGNKLSGEVPNELGTHLNLTSLDLRNNKLTKIPVNLDDLYYLNISNNNLSFDDIIPYKSKGIMDFSYWSQAQVSKDTLVSLKNGESYTINLEIDHAIIDNQYAWRKNNQLIKTTSTNSLTVSESGIYTCRITNPRVPDLELLSGKFEVEVTTAIDPLVSDSLALVALYHATDGDHWNRNDNWLTGPLDSWYGVSSNNRVGGINLYANNLRGKLPVEINNLTELSSFNLDYNDIHSIPDSLFFFHSRPLSAWMGDNRLTFEDLVNQPKFFAKLYDQQLVGKDTTVYLYEGESYTIELGIDEFVPDNEYVWMNDSVVIATTNVNHYTISDFRAEKAGVYTCQITNPRAQEHLSVLRSRPTILHIIPKSERPSLALSKRKSCLDEPITLTAGGRNAYESYQWEIIRLTENANIGLPEASRTAQSFDFSLSQTGTYKIRLTLSNPYAADTVLVNYVSINLPPQLSLATSANLSADSLMLTAMEAYNADSLIFEWYKVGPPENTILGNKNMLWVKEGGTYGVRVTNPSGCEVYAQTLVIDTRPQTQSITFDTIPDKVYGESFELQATASSGLPIAYEVIEGQELISLNDYTVSILGVGTVKLKAVQNGNGQYLAAEPVTQSFHIAKAPQQIHFAKISDIQLEERSFTFEASSSVGLPLTFIFNGPVSLVNQTITLLDTGVVTITASQDGSSYYLPAEPVSHSFHITQEMKKDTLHQLSIRIDAEFNQTFPLTLSLYQEQHGAYKLIAQESMLSAQLSFENLAEGKYTLKIKPEQGAYIPTYLGQQLLLSEAEKITLTQDREVRLSPIRIPDILKGTGITLRGVFMQSTQASNGKLMITKEAPDGIPVVGLTIYLIRTEDQSLVATTTTDGDGQFVFTNIPPGIYSIKADHRALSVDASAEFAVGDMPLDIIVMAGEEISLVSVEEGEEEVTAIEKEILQQLKFYPNPVEDELYLQLPATLIGGQLNIFDTHGRLVFTSPIPSAKVSCSLAHLSRGYYQLQISQQGKTYSLKILKK